MHLLRRAKCLISLLNLCNPTARGGAIRKKQWGIGTINRAEFRICLNSLYRCQMKMQTQPHADSCIFGHEPSWAIMSQHWGFGSNPWFMTGESTSVWDTQDMFWPISSLTRAINFHEICGGNHRVWLTFIHDIILISQIHWSSHAQISKHKSLI